MMTHLNYHSINCNKPKLSIALIIVIVSLFGFLSPVNAGILFKENFLLSYLDKFPENITGWATQTCEVGENGTSIQSYISRDGNYALKNYLAKDNPSCPDKNFRTEIASYKNQLLEYEKVYWIGFSIFIPNDWVVDQDALNMDYVFQLHSRPSPTSPKRDSILSLRISESIMKLVTQYDNVKIFDNWKYSINQMKGKWTDFVFKIKASQIAGQASLNLWVNKKQVFSKLSMSIGSPEDIDLYMKFGIYKPALYKRVTNIKSHTIYHDQIRVGDAKSNLEEVSPRGKAIVGSLPTPIPMKPAIPFTPTLNRQTVP
jgi:hypothetical protein